MVPAYFLKETHAEYITQNPISAGIFLTNGVSQAGVKSVRRLHKWLITPLLSE